VVAACAHANAAANAPITASFAQRAYATLKRHAINNSPVVQMIDAILAALCGHLARTVWAERHNAIKETLDPAPTLRFTNALHAINRTRKFELKAAYNLVYFRPI
jgi:hypothetical protein